MIQKIGSCVLLACAVMAGTADSAYAQRTAPVFGTTSDSVPMTINFTFGGFFPTGVDGRSDGDILRVNSLEFLSFDVDDFNGVTVGGEWLLPIGNFIEAGAGFSYYSKTVPSVYTDFVDADLTELEQDQRVRQVPYAFTVRALPFGQGSPVQPYIGAGLSVISWQYSITGEFIDFEQNAEVFSSSFTTNGTKTGLVIVGGLRYAGDAFAVGGEFRYQKAEADIDDDFADQISPLLPPPDRKLDLGGTTFQVTLGYRF